MIFDKRKQSKKYIQKNFGCGKSSDNQYACWNHSKISRGSWWVLGYG